MMQGLTANSADKEVHIDDFEILRTIGEGTFGKVKLARHILTGTQVAVKVIKKRRQNFSSVQALFREVCSVKALNHPNIVKLLGVIDTEETVFLVMEYLSGGDMYRYLKIHGRMTEAEARGPFQQLVSALQHCHQRGIVHRDLKPLNLLFHSNMNVRLTDFGLSNKCDDTGQLDTICGTPPYAAPELLLGQSYSGPAVDVWSLGVVLYTMVTGSRPFVGKDFQELRKQILQGQYLIPPYLSLEIRDLLQKMIALNPSDRGTLPDLMRHPWVNMGQKEPLQPPSGSSSQSPLSGGTCFQRHHLHNSIGSRALTGHLPTAESSPLDTEHSDHVPVNHLEGQSQMLQGWNPASGFWRCSQKASLTSCPLAITHWGL
uniref:non-specific serine/threonine protein kinase n=1 Tax=Balaenoptera musculus TaxID=9771 RepID=A0A8C0CZJ8_BALMU